MNAQLVLDSLGIDGKSVIGAVNTVSDAIRSASSPNMFSVGILRSFGVDTGKSSHENQYLARAAVEYAVKSLKSLDEPTVEGMNEYIKERVAGLRVNNPEFFEGETKMEEITTVAATEPTTVEATGTVIDPTGPKKRGRKPDLAKQDAVRAILQENVSIVNVRGDIVRLVMEKMNMSYQNARNYVLKAEEATGITLKSYDK